jgi:hypothetical protein
MEIDLNKTQGLAANDIDWGNPVEVEEIVQPTLEEIVVPSVEAKEIKEKEVEQPEVVLAKAEEVTFDDEEESNEPTKKTKTDNKSLQEEAVRAILRKKIEKYNFDVDEEELSELSGEELVDFQEQLDEAIIEAKYNEVKSSDPIIEQLLTLRENGGNVGDLLSVIEEQREINSIDTSTDKGKLKVIEKYYTEVTKWSEDKVQRKLDQVSNTGGIEDEFDLVNDTYQDHFATKQEEVVKQAEIQNRRQQQLMVQKQLAFEKELNSIKIAPKKREELLQTAFGKGTIKGTGEKIDILDYKILQMQANPQAMIKLAMFINNPEDYDQMILQNVTNKKTTESLKKEFQFNETKVKTPDNTSVRPTESKKKIQFNFNK